MLSVESTPLREESIQLWGADARPDVDGAHKNAVLFGDTKVLQSSPGEYPSSVSSSLRLQRCNILIIFIYIYIYNISIIFYLFCWCARTQPLARRSQPTVALVHYGREGQPTVAPTLHGKRACAHRSARVARVLHVAH